MEPEPVADVSEISFLRSYLLNKLQRLFQIEVRMVGFMSKVFDQQIFCTFDFFRFLIFDCLGIGDVDEISDSEAEHLHPVVHDLYGNHRNTGSLEREVLDHIFPYTGGTGIFIISGKDVVEAPPQGIHNPVMRIYGNVSLPEKIGADIVQADRMITVFMGKKNGIYPPDVIVEHLLPKIGSTVDYQYLFVHLYQGGYPKPFILKIRAEANGVITSDHWNSLRSTGTQKSDFQSDYFKDKTKYYFLFGPPFAYL